MRSVIRRKSALFRKRESEVGRTCSVSGYIYKKLLVQKAMDEDFQAVGQAEETGEEVK